MHTYYDVRMTLTGRFFTFCIVTAKRIHYPPRFGCALLRKFSPVGTFEVRGAPIRSRTLVYRNTRVIAARGGGQVCALRLHKMRNEGASAGG